MTQQLFLLILFTALTFECTLGQIQILEKKGDLFFRRGVEKIWEPLKDDSQIEENAVILAQANSSAQIKSDDRIFYLPAQSILDLREVKNYTQSQLVLILTSLEISNLPPVKSQPEQPSGAYVIHGQEAESQSETVEAPSEKYLEYEMNGLKALIEQNFWAGVLLKGFKLKKFSDSIDKEFLDYQMILASQKLNLTRRFQEAREKFLKDFPNSHFVIKE